MLSRLVLVPEEFALAAVPTEYIISEPALPVPSAETTAGPGQPGDHPRLPAELPALLQRAIQVVLTAQRPPRTVQRLAERCGCSRMTLWRSWRSAADGDEVRLLDFMAVALFYRYERLLRTGMAPAIARATIGLDARTVRRYRSQLEQPWFQWIWSMFERYTQV